MNINKQDTTAITYTRDIPPSGQAKLDVLVEGMCPDRYTSDKGSFAEKAARPWMVYLRTYLCN